MTGYLKIKFLVIFFIFTSLFYIDVNARKSSRHNKTRTKKLSRGEHPRFSAYMCLEDNNGIEKSSTALGISCKCGTIHAPICGSDDITYYNRCFMECIAKHAKHATNRYYWYKPHKLTLKHFGECQVNSTQSSIIQPTSTTSSSNTNSTQ